MFHLNAEFKWCKCSPDFISPKHDLFSMSFDLYYTYTCSENPHGKYIYGDLRKSAAFEVTTCTYVYKDTLEVAIGEELQCVREQSNAVDRYVVTVLKDDTVVGHLPKTSSCIYIRCS